MTEMELRSVYRREDRRLWRTRRRPALGRARYAFLILMLGALLSAAGAASTVPLMSDPATSGTADEWHTYSTAALVPSDCTYCVAPTGDDGAAGTQQQPWATFQHAADTAQPGDTVCFRGGTYPTEDTHLTVSGMAGAQITFIAYPGETPVLDGGGVSSALLILDQGVSYVRISGFGLRNFRIWGMEVVGDNRYLTLDHLDIDGGEASIRFTCCEAEQPPEAGPIEHIVVEDCIIHGSEYSAVDCTPGPCNDMIFRRLEIHSTGLVGEAFFGSDGLELARGQPILVEDCYVHDNGGDGIDLNSRDREGNVTGIMVRRNVAARNHLQGIKLWSGGEMVNNAVWGSGINPVVVGIYTGTYTVTNNTIAYNMWDTAYSERDYSFIAAYPEIGFSPAVTLTLVNNIFAYNADPTEGGATGLFLGEGVNLLREEDNLYFSREDGEISAEFVTGRDPDITRTEIGDGTWASLSGQGQGDLVVDPRVVAGWPSVDLHLQSDSPAIDTGSATGAPIDDVEGRGRDASPDIGAYEWGADYITPMPSVTPSATPSGTVTPGAGVYLPLLLRAP